ncbi:MAG: hypothetical protein LBU65_07210 [Planctomycetaceae bacterium]|jgi:Tfp pilus assembly protein PilN|nr:hypothetical protein [Planctomycetaceae bacterium]
MRLYIIIFLSFAVNVFADNTPLTLSSIASNDGRLQVKWELSLRNVRLSDNVTLTLRIEYAESIQIDVPVFDSSLGDFDVTNISDNVVSLTTSREVREVRLTLVPQHAGTLDVWQVPIYYRNADQPDTVLTLVLPRCQIEVAKSIPDGKVSLDEINAASPTLAESQRSRFWILAAAIVVVLLLALATALLWYRKRQMSNDEPTRSPHDIALSQLQTLWESRQHESDIRRFFIELTAIVRVYLEQTTGVHAPEQTTEEFLNEIGRKKGPQKLFDTETQSRLREFLEAADYVKFARAKPSRFEIQTSFDAAVRLVKESSTREYFHPEAQRREGKK